LNEFFLMDQLFALGSKGREENIFNREIILTPREK
jgi:hypothetical protein